MKNNNKGGFTLVEVMVASALLAITAGAMFSSLSWCRVIVFQNRCHEEAEQFAFDQLWNTFNMRWEELRDFHLSEGTRVTEVAENSLLADYNGEIWTAVYDYGDYFLIEVKVVWDNIGSAFSPYPAEETLRIYRYNTDRGL